MSRKIVGRALGAGFALATATALVLPGVASAEEGTGSSFDTLSAGSSDSLPGLDTIMCLVKNVGSADSEEDGEEADIDFSAILDCFGAGSSDDGDDGGNGDDGNGEGEGEGEGED